MVKNNSQRPDISPEIVRFHCKNLGSHIQCGSAISFGCLIDDLGETKVSDFAHQSSIFLFLQENILAFYVSMQDIIWMNDLHSSKNLVEKFNSFRKREDLVGEFCLVLQKISHVTVFHDEEVPSAFWMKCTCTWKSIFEPDDVGMIKWTHSVCLLREVNFELGVLHTLLERDAFDSKEYWRSIHKFRGQEHVTITPLP